MFLTGNFSCFLQAISLNIARMRTCSVLLLKLEFSCEPNKGLCTFKPFFKFQYCSLQAGYVFWCKSSICRQLSTEQAVLQESLEKESKVNKRLSMENEELLWKLHNGDLCSPRKLSPSSSSVPLQSPRNSGNFSSPAVSPRWHLLRERGACISFLICRTFPNFNHRNKSYISRLWQLNITGNHLVQKQR